MTTWKQKIPLKKKKSNFDEFAMLLFDLEDEEDAKEIQILFERIIAKLQVLRTKEKVYLKCIRMLRNLPFNVSQKITKLKVFFQLTQVQDNDLLKLSYFYCNSPNSREYLTKVLFFKDLNQYFEPLKPCVQRLDEEFYHEIVEEQIDKLLLRSPEFILKTLNYLAKQCQFNQSKIYCEKYSLGLKGNLYTK
jgi:hypothetical protein